MFEEIITFWFKEISPNNWFAKDDAFDQLIIDKYATIHEQASKCELYSWRSDAQGRLAEIIILDQFSRNMFRDSARSFAYDVLALALAQEAIAAGADKELPAIQRSFIYMPFMHSESLAIHNVAVKLYKENGLEQNLAYEIKHKEIIERFGRYPHRNKILGRPSTKEELAFLQLPNSGF